jgi:hypothetical protein
LSYPLWRGVTEWGIVLFLPKRPHTSNYAERLTRPSATIFEESPFEAQSVDEASYTSQGVRRHG